MEKKNKNIIFQGIKTSITTQKQPAMAQLTAIFANLRAYRIPEQSYFNFSQLLIEKNSNIYVMR